MIIPQEAVHQYHLSGLGNGGLQSHQKAEEGGGETTAAYVGPVAIEA